MHQVGFYYTDTGKCVCVVFTSTYKRVCCELLTTTVKLIGLFLKKSAISCCTARSISDPERRGAVTDSLEQRSYKDDSRSAHQFHSALSSNFQYRVPINLSWIAYIYIYIFPSHIDSVCICILKGYFKRILQH